jgi:hypothetical protein
MGFVSYRRRKRMVVRSSSTFMDRPRPYLEDPELRGR